MIPFPLQVYAAVMLTLALGLWGVSLWLERPRFKSAPPEVLNPQRLPDQLFGMAELVLLRAELLHEAQMYRKQLDVSAAQPDEDRTRVLMAWAINRAVARVEQEYRIVRLRSEG